MSQKRKLLKIEDFFKSENELNFLEQNKAYEFLLTIIGSHWEGKILIKEIKAPLWTLLIGGKNFSRTLTMMLNTQTNIKKLEEKFNYKPIFKIEVEPALLKQFREEKPKPTVEAPPMPQKGEGKKIILKKYLSAEIEKENKPEIIKIKKETFRNYRKKIYQFINQDNFIDLPIRTTVKITENSETSKHLFFEFRELIKNKNNKVKQSHLDKKKERKNLLDFIKKFDL